MLGEHGERRARRVNVTLSQRFTGSMKGESMLRCLHQNCMYVTVAADSEQWPSRDWWKWIWVGRPGWQVLNKEHGAPTGVSGGRALRLSHHHEPVCYSISLDAGSTRRLRMLARVTVAGRILARV